MVRGRAGDTGALYCGLQSAYNIPHMSCADVIRRTRWQPMVQYANLRYKFGTSSDRDTASADAERQSLRSDRSSKIPLRPIIPIRSIESPD
uniref:Uncharacterized protein n=1 Tax=Parascaris equorum TaxID=6256 RepID=A0A914S3C3_PAREQ